MKLKVKNNDIPKIPITLNILSSHITTCLFSVLTRYLVFLYARWVFKMRAGGNMPR